MGLLLGLLAALSFGVADFLARFSTEQVGAYRTLLYMQLLGLVGLSFYWLMAGLSLKFEGAASWETWAAAGIEVVLNLLGTLALYRALQVGPVSIVSPIAASYAVFTVLLSVLTGERLSLSSSLGIVALLAGVTVTATLFAPAAPQIPSDEQQGKPGRWSHGVGLALMVPWVTGYPTGYLASGSFPSWVRLQLSG